MRTVQVQLKMKTRRLSRGGGVCHHFGRLVARVLVVGVPVAGVPVAGVPVVGVSVVGVPVTGVPVAGVPVAGAPVDGVLITGVADVIAVSYPIACWLVVLWFRDQSR